MHSRIITEYTKDKLQLVVEVFRNGIHEICALLRLYAANNDSSLPTFRDKLSVVYSRFKQGLELSDA